MSDDAQLLRLYAEEKSEAAFAELVRRHLDLVYSAALRQVGGDAHRAHDVAQTVFIALARKAAAVARHPVLVGWLYTSTQHAAAKVRRSEARRRVREHEAQLMSALTAGDTTEAAEVAWEQVGPWLDEAMRELGERDREAVLLRFFARRPFAEIGATLRVSEDAARMRVERALEKLRGVLARRGVTSTGAALGVLLANQTAGAAPAGLAGSVTSGALAVGAVAAGVGGGSGVLAEIFTFMSTGKITVGVAIVCAAVGIGSAVYQTREVERAKETVMALRLEREAAERKAGVLTAKLRETEESARNAAERMAALERQLAAEKKTGDRPAAGGAVMTVDDSAKGEAAREDVWTKPGYAKAYLDQYRAGLGLRFGPLYRSLGLTPGQTAKFEAVLVEGQQGVVDVWTQASMQGLAQSNASGTATAVARLTSAPLTAMENGLKELLGDTGYACYEQFDKTGGSRELIMALAGGLYYSETPLTGAQGEALAGLIAANTKTVGTPMASDGQKPMFSLEQVTDWAAVTKQVPGVLSAAQVAAFERLNAGKRAEQEMNRILTEAAAPKPSR